MLVFARREGESVVISDGIRVKVIEIKEGVVRIGFEAPLTTLIQREESVTSETHRRHPRTRTQSSGC